MKDAEEFWACVDKNGPLVVRKLGRCWVWTRCTHRQGYGRAVWKRRTQLAHRISYALAKGELLPEEKVLHLCDNPPCVRPSHLRKGTQGDNVRDMFRKKRARPSAGDHNGMRLHPSSVRRGTLCREAKLNEEKVYEIKELCHAGLTRAELARRFQVSETLIRLIDQGKAWAHIYWP